MIVRYGSNSIQDVLTPIFTGGRLSILTWALMLLQFILVISNRL